MEDKILKEITQFCKGCASKECCPEDECVLFRIEQIIMKMTKQWRRNNERRGILFRRFKK